MNYGLKAIHLALFWLLTVPLTTLSAQPLEWIRPSANGDSFVRGERAEPFRAWGFNYDHDEPGRLLEDYWESEWDTVVADFSEMKALDANVVRIHLQLGSFMDSPDQPNAKALAQLKRLIRLAEEDRTVSQPHRAGLLPQKGSSGVVQQTRRNRPLENPGPLLGSHRQGGGPQSGHLLL